MDSKIINIVKEINQLEYACNSMLTKEYEKLLDDNISNSQIIVLGHIHENGSISTKELAKLMNISPSAISQTLNRLESSKYIKRTINPDNRREIIVQLDIKGEKYIEKSNKLEMEIIERFYSKMSWEDLLNLKNIMGKFAEIIKEEQESKE